jgi:hypothetical protein
MKFCNRIYFLLLLLFFCATNILAQEEIYDSPMHIMDTLEKKPAAAPATKLKQEKTNAMTAEEKRKERLNKLRIGGNFGMQFGAYTYINVSPTAGYLVAKNRLELGGGPIFIYQRYRYSSLYSYSFFVYGADAYARGFLYKGLYLEARYDPVNKPSYYNTDRRLWVHHLLLGAGYAAPIGKIGVFNISMLYNVLNNNESIYRGTFSDKVPLIINMGFGFGLGGK